MHRREFITILAGAAATRPLTAGAQQAGRVPRVGYIASSAEDDAQGRQFRRAFRDALEKLGWVDGRNIHIDYRLGATLDRRVPAAKDLVGSAPDVIVTTGPPLAAVLKLETRTIPIVIAGVTDPVGFGLVDSIARPGGNLTGFTSVEFSFGGKWLEMLKEVAPNLKRALVVLQPGNQGAKGLLRAIEAAGRILNIEVVEASTALGTSEIERAINAFARTPDGGLIGFSGTRALESRDLIVGLAAQHRLPAIYASRAFTDSGGLMSYDPDMTDIHRRAASYVDRILKGAKPGDLPFQNPTKFELVINLRTAKALGLTVPITLLGRADEVIE